MVHRVRERLPAVLLLALWGSAERATQAEDLCSPDRPVGNADLSRVASGSSRASAIRR